MTKSEEILKNTEARYIVEENKGQSKVAIYYHEEDVEKAISQSLTSTDVSQQRELLNAFVEEFVEAWEDGMGVDTDLYRKAKSLL